MRADCSTAAVRQLNTTPSAASTASGRQQSLRDQSRPSQYRATEMVNAPRCALP